VWQTYDYDLDVNGSYYGARAGCEAHHVQADPQHWSVLAVNHTADELRAAVVQADVLNLSGRRLAPRQRQTIDIAASSTAPAFTVAQPDSNYPVHLVRLRLTGADGTTLSENTYWRCAEPRDLQALTKLSGAVLRLTRGRARTGRDGRLTTTVTVRNAGDVVAPMVRLSLRDRRSGDRVLPARYSENYLWLLPGEQRTVTISCPRGERQPGNLEVTAQGYGTPVVSDRAGH
jgi:hypothetical protein